MNYESPGDFSEISLIASNINEEVKVQLPVEFRQPLPVDESLKWYVVVILVCGGLVVGLAVLAVVRWKKAKDIREQRGSLLEQGDGERTQGSV